jgi:23S rRNA pseudouridine2604 synthase
MRKLDSSIRYFLVQRMQISNSEAARLICTGKVLVNQKLVSVHYKLGPTDSISLNGTVLRPAAEFIYLAYYKPKGIETTLNAEIPCNLRTAITLEANTIPIGRLDKESEGLLLLSNDGRIYNRILMSHNKQEKEYLVTTDCPVSSQQLLELSSGIEIMKKKTLPARVERVDENIFRITLTEGRNRQIRRMCYKLGIEVEKLVRIRMMHIKLGELQPGQFRNLEKYEVSELLKEVGL